MFRAGGGRGVVADAEEGIVGKNGKCHGFLGIAVQPQILLGEYLYFRKGFLQEPKECGVAASAAAYHKPSGHSRGKPPQAQGNAICGKGGGCCQDVYQRIISEGNQFLHIFCAVVFPACGFWGLSVQVGIFQHPFQKFRNHGSGGGQLSSVVIAQGAAGEFHHQRIHNHVAGTGVKSCYVLQCAAGGEKRDIADAADVLQRHILGFTAVEQEFRVGHQGCTQASCGHIPDPEIADHRAAEFFGQIGGISDLQRAPDGGAQIGCFFGDVIDCLTVAADKIHPLCAGGLQQLPYCLGVEPAQMGSQKTDFFCAAALAAAGRQNGLTGGPVKGKKIKTKLLHSGGKAAACDPGQYGIDAVGRGAAHEPYHQPGRLIPKFRKRMVHFEYPLFFPVYQKTKGCQGGDSHCQRCLAKITPRRNDMEMTVKQMLGQKLIFGFHGTALSEEFKQLIREYQIGNVILFLRNVDSAEQLRRLCAEIQELVLEVTGYPAFIVIDQEGGMVTRLPGDAVNVPGAMAVSATNDPDNARTAAEITIRQLQGLGVNFNMAPSLDVNTNPANPVIGVRSFGDAPETVAAFGEASVRAYENTGVYCCGKHFPGHGDTSVDSHLGLPRIDKTIEELEQAELIPFRRCIEAGVPAIMSSHILFPNIEKENVPGTMSRTIITDLLKKRLGFKGLVFSDCLEMDAIQKYYGTAAGTVAAIKAGIDLAEISATISLMWDAARAVNEAAERGEFDMEEIRQSVEKILAVKRNMVVEPKPELCNLPEDRAAVERMSRQAVTCCAGNPPVADENTFFCGCGNFRASGVGNPDADTVSFPEYMAAAFGGGSVVISRNPGEEEIRAAVEAAFPYDRIVLGTINAHLSQGQQALAQVLAATGKELTVVALRNPYDIPVLPECACKLVAYDYGRPSFKALEDIFRGGAVTGTLPVKL